MGFSSGGPPASIRSIREGSNTLRLVFDTAALREKSLARPPHLRFDEDVAAEHQERSKRHRWEIIGIIVSLLAVIVVAAILAPEPRVQVVGNLPPDDLQQVLKLTRRELRFHLLPKLEWDDILYLGYVCRSLEEYQATKIQWVEVKPDGGVQVFAGKGRDVVNLGGHVCDFTKMPDWRLTGYGYWASSNVAPRDIHVPALP